VNASPFSLKRLGQALLFLLLTWLVGLLLFGGLLLNRALRLREALKKPETITLNLLAENIHGARREFGALRGLLAPAVWISSPLNREIAALNPLLAAGDESLAAADEILTALQPDLGSLQVNSLSMSQIPRLLAALVTARPALIRAETHLSQAEALVAEIPQPLSPPLARQVEKIQQLLRLARAGTVGAQALPGLLGQEEKRTYLILIQNSDELRPSGGFISAVGRLQMEHGEILTLTVQNSYELDDFTREYPYPPQPLLDYMGSEQWVLRDANWSPDFPSAARDVITLYQISRPETVNGVIAINTAGMKSLMAGLEPVNAPGISQPITSANFDQVLRDAWNPPADAAGSQQAWEKWLAERKQPLSAVLEVALQKLQSGQANWGKLALGAAQALDRRDILVYSQAEAEILQQAGWDGSLRQTSGDFLMTVDANVGFSKTNALLQKNLSYQVTLAPDGSGQAALTQTYQHTGSSGVPCVQTFNYDWKVTYQQMMNRCYFDYLRVLVPPHSQLLQATALPTPAEYLLSAQPQSGQVVTLENEIPGKTVFGQFFTVESGKSIQTQLLYRLPQVAAPENGRWRYTLLLQKQPGAASFPAKIQVLLPEKARLVSSIPASTDSGNMVEFNLNLEVDQVVQVWYVLTP